MLLRKINAAISMVTTLLLMGHAVVMGVWMLSQGAVTPNVGKLPWMLVGLMVLHAVLSIVLAVLGHKGADKCKCNGYAKLNVSTYVQRVSGVLLIVFTALHVLGASGIMRPPLPVHVVVPPLFFALSLAHAAVSVSKALITLGIGTAKTVKVVDIVTKLVCGVTLLADVSGFYLYRV